MDVGAIADVDGDHLSRRRQRQRCRLRFAQHRPWTLLRRVRTGAEARQLHPQERQGRRIPLRAPLFDHRRKQRAVAQRLLHCIGVGFALVPDRATQRIRLQRMDHRVVEQRRELVLVVVGRDQPRLGEAEAPFAVQRASRAVGQLHEDLGRHAMHTAAAAGIRDLHRDIVAARAQRRRRHRVGARQVVLQRGLADLHAIDPGRIRIVDATDGQGHPRLRFCRAEVERGAIPGDAIDDRPALRFPDARYLDRCPHGRVQARRLPVAVVGASRWPLGKPAPRLRGGPLIVRARLALGGDRVGRVEALRVRVHPRLDAAATPGAVDDADRHAGRLAQLDREVIRGGGKLPHRCRRCRDPFAALQLPLRRAGPGLGNFEVADQRIARGSDGGVGTFGLRQRPFHVRLPAGQPDVADQQIAQFDRRDAIVDAHPQRTTGGVRRQQDAPVALGIGDRRHRLAI